jgi:SCY1-like protein 2
MKGAWNLDQFTAALTSAGKTAAQAAVKVSKAVATEVVHGVVGAECCLDYNLDQQPAATCGPWFLYMGRNKNVNASQNLLVTVWVLDKNSLLVSAGNDRNRTVRRQLEALIELCRKEVQHLARLKHPSIIRLVAPLEELRNQLVFLTEPVSFSLADVLSLSSSGSSSYHQRYYSSNNGNYNGNTGTTNTTIAPHIQEQMRNINISELEAKHGLLQVADGLTFLHQSAGLVHRSISPRSILVTRSGSWKLAGFGFTVPLDGQVSTRNSFDYSDRHPSNLGQALHPLLNYVAPELVATGRGVAILPAADVFSLAAVTYELITHRSLLPSTCSLVDYEIQITNLTQHSNSISGTPPQLEQILRQMLAPVPEARPPVASYAACSYFQGDVHLRALKFLDSILQKGIEQRAAFLHDLPKMAAHFDRRVLLYTILPPLLHELRTKELQGAALPIIMTILKVQSPEDFSDITLPALKPLLEGATGSTLLQLTQAAPIFQGAVTGKSQAAQLVPKLLVRAMESGGGGGDAACQKEALKQVIGLSEGIDYNSLKEIILPAVHATCLTTTNASIRVLAFRALASMAGRVDVSEAEQMLATAATCVSVDKTAPTAMCVLGLGDALAKKWGAKLAAERVLPALAPLLVTPSLTSQQFATATKTLRDMLSLIERSRGGSSSGGDGIEESNGSGIGGVVMDSKKEMKLVLQQQQQSVDLNLDDWSWSGGAAPSATATAAVSPRTSSRKNGPARIGPLKMNSKGSSTIASPVFTDSFTAATTGNAVADPLAWLPSTIAPTTSSSGNSRVRKQATAAAAAVVVPTDDPLAGLWTNAAPKSSGLKQNKPSTTLPTSSAAVFDPFDDLALQHSTTRSGGTDKQGNTVATQPPPSLI